MNPMHLTDVHKTGKVGRWINKLEKEEDVKWVSYGIDQWADLVGNPKDGICERVINSLDAISMMSCDRPSQYQNMIQALEGVDEVVDVIFDGAKRKSKNRGYSVTVADQGKGQENDSFDSFVTTSGSGGNKGDMAIVQGCRMLGSLSSVAASKYILIMSSHYEDENIWSWTIIRNTDDGIEYLKNEDEFPSFKGSVNNLGSVDEREYGTIVKHYDYGMPSPEKAAQGHKFRRLLAHQIPNPALPIRIIDNRWDGKYLYEGLESDVDEEILTGRDSFLFEDERYGLVKVTCLAFDMSDEYAGDRKNFISTSDDSRLMVQVNGQTHHIESPEKVKSQVGLGEVSGRCIISVQMLNTETVKKEKPFDFNRRGFQNSKEKQDFMQDVYGRIEDQIDPSQMVPDKGLCNVSTTDFSASLDGRTYEIRNQEYKCIEVDVSPYLNELDQEVSIESRDSRVTADVTDTDRQSIEMVVGPTVTDDTVEIRTTLIFDLDGEYADTAKIKIQVDNEEEGSCEETAEETEDEDVTIGGDKINGFCVPDNPISQGKVEEAVLNELPEFVEKGYKKVEQMDLEDIGMNDNTGEFYETISQYSGETLEEEIESRIRAKCRASEETRAGNFVEKVAAGIRGQRIDKDTDNPPVSAGVNGCEPDWYDENNDIKYLLQIKMGTRTMNADMGEGFNHAKSVVNSRENQEMILAIAEGSRSDAIGNMGSNIDNIENCLLCGREMWYWLTGNEDVANNFYDILDDMESEVKNEKWNKSTDQLIDDKTQELATKYREKHNGTR